MVPKPMTCIAGPPSHPKAADVLKEAAAGTPLKPIYLSATVCLQIPALNFESKIPPCARTCFCPLPNAMQSRTNKEMGQPCCVMDFSSKGVNAHNLILLAGWPQRLLLKLLLAAYALKFSFDRSTGNAHNIPACRAALKAPPRVQSSSSWFGRFY
eukprot:scaffold122121_cov24-Tisochrysis_lutea.AAC.2